MTLVTQEQALQHIERATYGYMESLKSEFTNLIFDDRGFARLASIAGFITGLSCNEATKELAAKLAFEILETLDRLNKWGQQHEPIMDGRRRIDPVKVLIGDDGTFNGFSILWFNYLKPEAMAENNIQVDGSKARKLGPWGDVYLFAFNGGLIYHGPGAGQTFTVNLTANSGYWGIHT